MSTFGWLFVGHLVGDFLLQNEWMANGKKKRLLNTAGMVHYAIYTAAILAALWFSNTGSHDAMNYVLMAVVIFLSHALLDSTRIVGRWMSFFHQSNTEFMRVMVDQVLHLLVLVLLVVFVSDSA